MKARTPKDGLFKIYHIEPFNCNIYFLWNTSKEASLKYLKKYWKGEVIETFCNNWDDCQQGLNSGFTIYGTNGHSLVYVGDSTINTIIHEFTHAIIGALTTVGEPVESEATAYIFGNIIERAISDALTMPI